MTTPVPTSANEFIERQLHERLVAVERAFNAAAITIVGPLIIGVDDYLRTVIEEIRQRDPVRSRLLVLITTYGGSIEVVQRIVEMLRHHYKHVAFVIPNYAFSAGTILVMSGDEIHMDYYSRLGPIDPQMQNDKGRLVPALGYLIQWERLIKKANDGTLTLEEAQLMIQGFDQAELYQIEQARALSIALLKEWLVRYKFKNWKKTATQGEKVTEQRRLDRAESIALELNNTERWHSHGHGISMQVLQTDLKLPIDNLDDSQDRRDLVRQYDGLLSDYMSTRRHVGVLHAVDRYFPFM